MESVCKTEMPLKQRERRRECERLRETKGLRERRGERERMRESAMILKKMMGNGKR